MEKNVYTVAESMAEMQSINLSNLKNSAHREFVNDTLIEARKTAAIRQNLSQQLEALEATYAEEMQASLIEETVQRLTEEIYRLSEERSKAQTALKSGLRAVEGMTDAQKVAAATVLFDLMHKYDLHTGMNVDEQTAVIDSFLLDVDEHYAAQMQATGMQELYQLLKVWNQRVCDKVVERDEAKVGLGTARMENARLATDRAWRDLRTAVNAFAYVQGSADYSEFIGYMNVLIVRYKRTHLTEKTKSPEETTPTTPGTPTGPDDENGQPPTPTPPEETEYTATFKYHDNTEDSVTAPAGAPLNAPAPDSGYTWSPTPPATMPAANTTYIEVAESETTYTIAWYDNHGQPLAYYHLPVGATVPEAPAPPEGYRWPTFPTTMPDHDVDVQPVAI